MGCPSKQVPDVNWACGPRMVKVSISACLSVGLRYDSGDSSVRDTSIFVLCLLR